MAISEFTKLAQTTQPGSTPKPSSFTEMASSTVSTREPRGLVRSVFPELVKRGVAGGVKAVADYIAIEEEKRKEMTLGELFMNDVIKKPAKIIGTVGQFAVGGLSSMGKTIMEAYLPIIYKNQGVTQEMVGESTRVGIQTDEDVQMNQVKLNAATEVNRWLTGESRHSSLQDLIMEVQPSIENHPDATPWEKQNLAPMMGMMLFAADAFPGKPSAGGLSKKLLKELAKDTDVISISTKLKAGGVPEQIANRAADRVVTAKTPGAVNDAVRAATRESIDEAAGVSAKTATPSLETIPAPLRPLAVEARKYVDAEDFVKAIEKKGNIEGTVPKWGTRNQYLADTLKAEGDKGIGELGERFELSKVLEDKPAFLNSALSEGEIKKFADENGLVYMEANGREVVAKTVDDAMRVIDAEDQRELGLSLGYEDLGGPMSDKKLKEFYDQATGGLPITASAQGLQSTLALSAPTQLGKPRPTAGMTLRSQSGEVPDPNQVDRAFAGEYTGGDGVSRTLDEVAEDVMTTTAEPVLAARTIATMQSTKTKVLEYVQNTEERIRQLQNDPNIRISGDDADPYQAMTRMPGIVGAKIEDTQKTLKTMFSDMESVAKQSKRKLKDIRQDVNDYLWLRHAPERNASLGDGAAGITTKEAAERMEVLKTSPFFKDVERFAHEVTELNREALDTLLDSGVIKRELYDTLQNKYKNYAPLNRILETTSDIEGSLSGRGFDVKSTGIRRAKGSSREVADIVENTILNYEQAIIRSEKNIVDRATLQFVRDNKAALDGLMTVKRPRGLETTDDPNILQLFEDGKRVWVKIDDPNLAIAYKGTGRQQMPGILRFVGAYSRFLSSMATRWAADFAPVNLIRDIQERTVFLSAQKDIGVKEAFKSVKRDPASIKSVTDFVLGRDTADAALYMEMRRLGGTTGGLGLSTRKKTQLNIRHLETLAQNKPRKYAEGVLEYLDNWNTIFEDATRLTTYKTALANGSTKKQSAALAKEATVNFNRMGKGGPVINAMYMFANASIQGSVKTVRAMKNPKVLMGLTVTVGTAVTAVNQWNDSVDPEWRKKVSKWDTANGLPVVLPSDDGRFEVIAIPVAWGIKPIRVAADYAYQLANGENVTAIDATEGILVSIMEAYNPVGGSDLLSAAMPTILDLPVEIARNEKWSGSAIKPNFDPYAPESVKYFDSLENKTTGKIAISLTQKLAGYGIEISPSDIVYAFESMTSSAGRFTSKAIDLGIRPVTEGELPAISDFPFISRFYKAKAEDEIFNTQAQSNLKELFSEDRRERFYEKKKAQDAWDSIAELSPEEKKQKLIDMKAQDPELLKKVIDIAQAEKLGLVGEERQLKTATVKVRAQYIAAELKSLSTPEERKALLQNYREKKILSEAVIAEIKALQSGAE